jgi:hypothetical protein
MVTVDDCDPCLRPLQLKTLKIAYLSKLIAVKVDTEHIADTFST